MPQMRPGKSFYVACNCLKYNCKGKLVAARTFARHAKADFHETAGERQEQPTRVIALPQCCK
jgi:hypothetical protein